MDPGERATQFRLVIRDRDSKFTAMSGHALAGSGVRIIKTPVRAPRSSEPLREFWHGTRGRHEPDRRDGRSALAASSAAAVRP
jgi:hypothetical protein